MRRLLLHLLLVLLALLHLVPTRALAQTTIVFTGNTYGEYAPCPT